MYCIVGNLYYDLIYLSENVYVDILAAVPIQILMIIVLKYIYKINFQIKPQTQYPQAHIHTVKFTYTCTHKQKYTL